MSKTPGDGGGEGVRIETKEVLRNANNKGNKTEKKSRSGQSFISGQTWLTYNIAPFSFRTIFREKGSGLNSTLYFGFEAFDVADGIGTGTSYLFSLES